MEKIKSRAKRRRIKGKKKNEETIAFNRSSVFDYRERKVCSLGQVLFVISRLKIEGSIEIKREPLLEERIHSYIHSYTHSCMHTSWRSNFFSEFPERKESKKSNVLGSKSFQWNAIKTRETMSDEEACKRVDLTSSSSFERENRRRRRWM